MRTLLLRGLAALPVLFLLHCASVPGVRTDSARVSVTSADRITLRVEPFDSTVRAELARAGLDPARVWDELNAELRYQLFLRGQEEAIDSAGATLRITATVRHLQPGSGNAGSFVSLALRGDRADRTERTEWEWRPPARANVPPAFAERHLSRAVAHQFLERIKAGRVRPDYGDLDHPPPLILIR